MTAPTYVTHETVSLKTHPHFNEAWLHERIKADPTILGLGDVHVLDHERKHSGAGRLDLLLFDAEQNRRYEVEVMLGATDPSHLVRTIEYWDIERRRYPGYDHVAVLIAEDITSRYLNVLSLMSGNIPFIAIQLSALQVNDLILLNFVRVLDQTELRIDDVAERSGGIQVDRSYWENYSGKQAMMLCDQLLKLLNKNLATPYVFNYLEGYIGLRKNDVVNNLMWFVPRRKGGVVLVAMRTGASTSDWNDKFEKVGLESKLHTQREVKLKLTTEKFEANKALIEEAVQVTAKENDA